MEYKQNDKVAYKIDNKCKGYGRIVGVATTEMPIIGCNYIIEDLSGNFPNKEYPYSHFALHSVYITSIENK